LGLNLYAGCSHDCLYCYNKEEDRYQGPYDKPAKGASLKNIKRELQILHSNRDRRPVHMSFMGDPYDLGRKDDDKPKGIFQYFGDDELKGIPKANDSYTRTVLKAFRLFDQPFQILTKGGTKAAKDFDLYGPNDWFGVTLTFDNDPDSKKWEPGAALPGDRISTLKEAHSQTINTWVSCEPVIDPAQTLHLIELTHEFVDFFWVGKLNHHPKIEEKIDWSKFRRDAEALLQKYGKEPGSGYGIKKELIEASKLIRSC
jgi:DNA repair photolyase